jgi:hypothetical protein
VEGCRHNDVEDSEDSTRFFYEEHSCPTNHVRCETIISEGDPDPHGIFTFVRRIDRPETLENCGDHQFLELFPECQRLAP